MSFEVFEKALSALTTEQQAIVYNLVVSLGNMNENKHEEKGGMSKEETMRLFNDLSGCIKSETQIDARKEYLEYLDERYGV
ncbi:hypothetical protein IKO70_02470 [bacterium]|nr:hypothetical protein [bacterium]